MNNESEASSYELQFSIDPSEVIVDQIFIWYLEELKLSNSCFDISIIKILKLNSIQIVDESRKRIQIRLDQIFIIIFTRRIEIIQLLFRYFHN